MYEPIVDNTGPNLGKLAVWTRTRDRDDNAVMTPLWRLQNGQGPSWKYAQANIDSDRDYEVRWRVNCRADLQLSKQNRTD